MRFPYREVVGAMAVKYLFSFFFIDIYYVSGTRPSNLYFILPHGPRDVLLVWTCYRCPDMETDAECQRLSGQVRLSVSQGGEGWQPVKLRFLFTYLMSFINGAQNMFIRSSHSNLESQTKCNTTNAQESNITIISHIGS